MKRKLFLPYMGKRLHKFYNGHILLKIGLPNDKRITRLTPKQRSMFYLVFVKLLDQKYYKFHSGNITEYIAHTFQYKRNDVVALTKYIYANYMI